VYQVLQYYLHIFSNLSPQFHPHISFSSSSFLQLLLHTAISYPDVPVIPFIITPQRTFLAMHTSLLIGFAWTLIRLSCWYIYARDRVEVVTNPLELIVTQNHRSPLHLCLYVTPHSLYASSLDFEYEVCSLAVYLVTTLFSGARIQHRS